MKQEDRRPAGGTTASLDWRPSRPGTSARRLDLAIALFAVLGLAIFALLYDQAFPSAAIDLSLSRAEVAEQARSHLALWGHNAEGYSFALTFDEDTWASYYLQRTLGVPKTNQLVKEARLPIWQWRARWFRPLQKEEFVLRLAPDGRVVGLSHALLEDAPGGSLDQEQARELARAYLTHERGWDLAQWEEVSASSTDRPGGRTDYYFAWKKSDWDVGDSELRLAVTVQGDEIGSYNYWLKTPEAFQRDFAESRNLPYFINNLSLVFSLGLAAVAAILALWQYRAQIPSLHAAPWLPPVIVGVVALASGVNELPLAKAWYETTQDYLLFWLNHLLGLGFSALYYAMLILLLWHVGQWLSKKVWPRADRILPRRGDRWNALARSGWRGLALGLIKAGYVVLFYLVATRVLGGWTPLAPDYTHAYATPLPFLGALEVGLLPAMWEELMFRFLLVIGVLWVTRTFTRLPGSACQLLALLVPGALWGFGHLSYIRDPFYLRGIELTLSAMMLGLFFMRFDLTTTVVAHFVYNAGLTALPLLRSKDPYFVASGIVVVLCMAAPIIPAYVRAATQRMRGTQPDVTEPCIRLASAEDLAALASLPIGGLDWPALLAESGAAVLCLWLAGRLVGVAAGHTRPDGTGEILAVYVAPPWRRQYWGSELVDRLCQRLVTLGAQAVEIRALLNNRIGLSFWHAQAWSKTSVTFIWPPHSPSFPSWAKLLSRLSHRQRTPNDS